MSYNLYKAQAKEVIIDSNKIENLEERIEYLIKAKREFTANNSGPDVMMIVSIYDSEIELTKFKLQKMQNKSNKELSSFGDIEIIDLPKVIEITPQKSTVTMPKPELNAIFEDLPKIIDECEKEGHRLAERDLATMKDEITFAPERKEQEIINYRDNHIKQYQYYIKSGYNLKATDKKDEMLQKIKLVLTDKPHKVTLISNNRNSNVKRTTIEGQLRADISLMFYHYFFIRACNELLNPDKPTTGTTKSSEPKQETTEQKIKRILEPLRLAFDDSTHIDKIMKALVEYSDNGELPAKAERKVIQVPNPEFYPYFKKVKSETNLTVPGIADVLVYFVCQNNGTGNPIAPGTIKTNIKKSYPNL